MHLHGKTKRHAGKVAYGGKRRTRRAGRKGGNAMATKVVGGRRRRRSRKTRKSRKSRRH